MSNYSSLLTSSEYEHRICGMHIDCAIFIRENRGKEPLRTFANAVAAGNNIGVWIGSVMGSPWAESVTYNEDVIICFLSDITNIDSKQVTFVKNSLPNKGEIFDKYYKKDFVSQNVVSS